MEKTAIPLDPRTHPRNEESVDETIPEGLQLSPELKALSQNKRVTENQAVEAALSQFFSSDPDDNVFHIAELPRPHVEEVVRLVFKAGVRTAFNSTTAQPSLGPDFEPKTHSTYGG